MKVLLANPPWNVNGKKGVRAGSRWPHLKITEEEDYMPFPFFLAYAAALIKKNNINVLLIDAIAESMSNTNFLDKIKDYKPNIVLLEVSTPSLKIDLELARKIKEFDNSVKIALTGLDMNIRNQKFLEKNRFIDFVLVGGYEFTLLGLVNCLKNKDNLSKVLGLIYRDKGKVIINKKRSLQNINKLPWPLREQLPTHKYNDCPGGIPQPSVQMLASRGCPYHCIFCAWPQIMYHGSNYRTRNPIDVVDEMEFLVRKKGFKSVYFDDDTFNIGRKRMFKICNEIKKRKLNIPWAIMARADLMDKELLDEMKSAGLYAVKYGVESAVQKLVDNANKDLNLKKAEEMIRYTNKIGIKTHLTFMFGLPGETHETIQKTIDFALRMNPESVQFSITTPFPGTKYYNELNKKGMLISKKWSDYDGNFKSVIKTRELSPEELEGAVRKAYNSWAEHRQKRLKHNNSLTIFKKCLDEHGPKYTAKRVISKVFKKKDINRKEQEQKKIPKKNLILKNFYDNRLDLISVVDGKHAFTFPNLVQIDLTNKCNNSCIGCWCNSPLLKEKRISGKEKEETLPYNRIIRLIDELKEHGTNEIYLGGGGEPFMHLNVMKIVEYIKKKGLVCHINTNFTLVNEGIAKKLVDLEVDHIAVSLWAGDSETYVKTHPNQSKKIFYQMEKTLKLIKKLKDEKKQEKPLIKVYDVISSLNYKNVDKMAEFVYKTADSVEFTVIDVVEGKTESLLLNEKQRKNLLERSIKLKEKYKNKKGFVIFRFDQFLKRISNPLSVKGLYDKKSVDSIPCYVGWTFSRILANGNVIPCLKAHKKPMGNILKSNFNNIFFSKKYNEFRFMAKKYKKNNQFFKCINCYKSCDDLGRNNEIHKQIISLSSDEKEMLNYARDLRTIKGMIEFLKNKKIKTTKYGKERKEILDNILNWDIKKIKKGVTNLIKRLKNEINFYEFYMHSGMNKEIYSQAIIISIKKEGLLKLKKQFEKIQGMIDFLKNKKIKTTKYGKERKEILDNILNWDIKKIKKEVNQLYIKLNKKIRIFSISLYKNKLKGKELQKKVEQQFKKEFDKLDILLVMCPPWDIKSPPLNLAYLVTYLKNKEIKADVYDFNILFYHSVSKNEKVYWEMENLWDNLSNGYINKILNDNNYLINKFVSQIAKKDIKTIGFSINQSNFLFSLQIANKIKKENKNIKIIFGGSAIFYDKFRNKTPKKICDYFVIGEGEETLYELVIALRKEEKIENIKGVMINSRDYKCKFVPRNPIMNINKIPFPTFEEFDLKLYTNKQLSILTSRGCIGRCAYCVDYVMSNCYRFKSAKKIVEELMFLKREYSINKFQLNDLLCNGNLNELEKTCDLIIKNKLKVELFGYFTIRKDMNIKLLKKMKKAGYVSTHYGFESGSNRVLKLMNKKYTSEDAEILIRKTKNVGIKVIINIIVGFPGERKEDFNKTIEFIKRNKHYIDIIGNVSICFIMRGSMIYKYPERFGFTLTSNPEKWYGNYNNRIIRTKKAIQIIKLINKLGIELGIKNIYKDNLNHKKG